MPSSNQMPNPHDTQTYAHYDVAEMAGNSSHDFRRRSAATDAPTVSCCSCHQFIACMKKNVHQKRRDKCGCCLELCLPILFVIGTVLIWKAFGNEVKPAEQFVDYTNNGNAVVLSGLRQNLCYSGSDAIDGLQACASASFSATVRCFTDDKSVPVSGLCYNSNTAQFNPSWYVGGLFTTTRLVAPLALDDMIAVQWLARHTIAKRIRRSDYQTATAALTTSGKLYFVPDTAAVAALVDHLNRTNTLFKYVYGGTFASTAAAELHVKSPGTEGRNWGIVHVDSMTPTNFNVRIRLNHTTIPNTDTMLDEYYLGGTTEFNMLYVQNGFYSLQIAVSDYFVNYVANTTTTTVPAPWVVPMGYDKYDTQAFLAFGGSLAPLIIVLGFLYPVSQLAKRLVLEKELRIREAMLIMGLRNSAFYVSWIVTYVLQNLLCTVIITIILKSTYVTRVNTGALFFCFFFFQLSTITLSGFISAFFSKSRLAALITPLVYVGLSMPLFATEKGSPGMRSGLLILSPTAFANGIQLIFQNELGGGLGPEQLTKDSPSMIAVLAMLAVDTLLYLFGWLYVDAIMPNDWGTPRHPLFCIVEPIRALMRCCSSAKDPDQYLPDGRNPQGVFEESKSSERTTVKICGLKKEFNRGGKTFTAVDNLYWTLEEGQISVLLGHNGAGKTTTLNMMTGMLEADSGDCFIYGYSVRHELHQVRREIGYCPQHNILWPELTCEEHLNFFASVKGLTGSQRDAAVTEMLRAVDLADKRHELSSALSGGQKRKLSVANAFVGGSRLIFLDEPTAGMDVAARRHTWDLLRKMSETHTILLTTHFMDEADLLGHKVAIMSKGALQCSGSSLFLKSRLGVGYNIVLSVNAHVNNALIDSSIRRFVHDAELLSTGVGEIVYRLPTSAIPHFPPMMRELEERGAAIGVRNFSVSATTLEEVFLEIALGEETKSKKAGHPVKAAIAGAPASEFVEMDVRDYSDNGSNCNGAAPTRFDSARQTDANAPTHVKIPPHAASCVWSVRRIEKDSNSLLWSQLQCMLTKRFKNSLRDRRTQCLQIICPVVCILLAMLFTLLKFDEAPAFVVSSDRYGEAIEVPVWNCVPPLMSPATVPFSSQAVTLTPTGITDAQGLSNWLVANAKSHGDRPRYGALACSDSTMQTATGSTQSVSLVFYNSSAMHEITVGVFNYYNAIYRQMQGAGTYMTLVNDPMPKTDRETAMTDSMKSITIGIIIMIPFTFIPSTFVSWIVKERECKARHLQNVSGLRFSVYWLSNFLFDMASFIVTMCLAIVVFAIFNRTEYISSDSIGGTIVLLLFYGLAGVAFAYTTSFLFDEHATAQNIVMLGNFVTGFLLVLLVFILGLVDSTKDAAKVLAFIFRVIPSFALGDGIINLALHQLRLAFGTTETVFSMDVIGWDVLYLAIEFPIVFLITLIVDHPWRRNRTQSLLHDPNAAPEVIENEDEDVARERKEVEDLAHHHRDGDLVVVKNLRKKYDNGKVAVRNLSFGVHPGEVFGFLGTNGAGKTTTISILCQETYPTSGHAYVAGLDVVSQASEALQCIGYCPQFDALLDLLTVEEHLYLYAGVRGIVQEDREAIVSNLASLCELTEYMKTVASELSGGNKRKLSVALSLIGGPSVVFLDEPSAGMDPVARRGLWTAISTVADNCAVVLTTHHLEEVEALAHRVAIMVDGRLHCIGDKLHLKTKFGSGFEMNVRLADDKHRRNFEAFVAQCFPEATLSECRSLRFTYALPQTTRLSAAFGLIEEHKANLGITDYSIAQTSIEQVFLRISAENEASDAHSGSPKH